MKSAEEWSEQYPLEPLKSFQELVKQIQLDAWKQGMEDARALHVREIKSLKAHDQWKSEAIATNNFHHEWYTEHKDTYNLYENILPPKYETKNNPQN